MLLMRSPQLVQQFLTPTHEGLAQHLVGGFFSPGGLRLQHFPSQHFNLPHLTPLQHEDLQQGLHLQFLKQFSFEKH